MSDDVSDASADARAEAERELQLLAVLDRFAGEVEAGAVPRLAAYLERYPGFAAELVDFAAGYLSGTVDAYSAGGAATYAGARVPEGDLSAGSRRALALLFPDSSHRGESSGYAAPGAGSLRAVAERRAEYAAGESGLGGAEGSGAEGSGVEGSGES